MGNKINDPIARLMGLRYKSHPWHGLEVGEDAPEVVTAFIEMVPTDAKAHYYLGNLYYEHQPQRAIELWERSRELDDTFYITHRNLALAYKDIEQDYAKALESITRANQCNSDDPRLLFETDVINNLNGLSAKEKYEFLIKNRKTAEKHYETLLRLITRAVEYGKYDEALDLLDSNDIIESEGAREKQSAYLNSYALKAWNLLGRGRASAALDVMQKALDYPVGLYGRAQYAQLYYITAAAYDKKGDKAKAAQDAGADYVGDVDYVEKITKENWFEFDVVIATPDMMGLVGRLGKVLGPCGLMPSPKAGTVTPDVAKAVTEAKAGKIEYRLDKTNIIHCPIGKASFGAEKLQENFNALMAAIIKAKPEAAKGQYIKSCVLATTMGPGIKLNVAKFGN